VGHQFELGDHADGRDRIGDERFESGHQSDFSGGQASFLRTGFIELAANFVDGHRRNVGCAHAHLRVVHDGERIEGVLQS